MFNELKKATVLAALLLTGGIALPGIAGDDIAVSELPKAVTQAIMKRYPDAKLIKAEREKDNGKLHYEVNIQTGDKRLEINVRPDGTIYNVENEEDDD